MKPGDFSRRASWCWWFVALVCTFNAVGGRTLPPPPFILDRSKGAAVAEQIDKIASDTRLSPERRAARIQKVFAEAVGGVRTTREFPRGVHFDPMRIDVRRVMTNMLKGNRKNWGGYFRELKLINVASSPRSPFLLGEVGSRRNIVDGKKVEFDLELTEKRRKLQMAVEVKDWNIRTKADLEDAKVQIENIAKRAAEEGKRPIWVNRDGVRPKYRDELADFARRKGLGFYDEVTTGDKQISLGKAKVHIDDVLDREAKLLSRAALARTGGKVVGGAAVLIDAGRAGVIAWQWHQGRVSTRQAVVTGGGAAAGAAGGAAGMWLGAKGGAAIGTFIAPGIGTAIGTGVGALVGGIGGAFAGEWAGSKVATYSVDKLIYGPLEEAEKAEVLRSLKQHYQPAP